MSKPLTFASAIDAAHDPERHPWVYATGTTGGGHVLLAAHCVEDCPEPATCDCEEQTHIEQKTLAELYVMAVGADALCCGRAIEDWCAADADLILQIALWGRQVFG